MDGDRMGIYLNPGNEGFASAVNSEIYMDKTRFLEYTNKILDTEQRFLCVSRPRRFGKSMTAEMLVSYYGKGCDSNELFKGLKIADCDTYEVHRNAYDVIHIDMGGFLAEVSDVKKIVSVVQEKVIEELKEAFPSCDLSQVSTLPTALSLIKNQCGTSFVMIIDEWDALFREEKYDFETQDAYVNMLRGLFKDAASKRFIKLAYMTGILPIKKYGTQSALNNFYEYTMMNSGLLAEYIGFLEDEVQKLCKKYDMDFEEAKCWYDGYSFKKAEHIYSPKSVVEAMLRQDYDNYWTRTETYESLKKYISMNFDGLKDAVIHMLGGGRCKLSTNTFQNDFINFHNKDDVLTLLVHLGYLAYDANRKEVYIPNHEVESEFAEAVKGAGWKEVANSIEASERLLEATISGDENVVAQMIDEVHADSTSILNYHNENALSCVISIAYYSARNYYTMHRELPTGKGFADIVFLPRTQYVDEKPVIIVELKWDKTAQGAISQIKEKNYVNTLKEYTGDVLLVGINYDKETKQHHCLIEKYRKETI